MREKSPFFKVTALFLICLAFALVNSPAAQVQSPGAQWEPAIRAFQKNDQIHPPPQNAVLFVGSSAIRKWNTLAKDFPGIQVINRGFGGSQIADSILFASRIIFPYHPRIIVVYDGENDLWAGKTPDQVVAEYTNFVAEVREQLPQTRIIFISLKPSPVRWKRLKNEIIETNRRIASMNGEHLEFVNVFPHMLDANGNPRKDLFLSDGLHPNETCYQMWASLIRPYLN